MTWRCIITRAPRWVYATFFLAGLAVLGLACIFERAPGYMDAEYYYSGGLDLAKGRGFFQSTLWNYLDDPETIPHPSHTYWMPLTSLLAAAGLLANESFAAARVPFWLLAALIPPVTVYLGQRLHGDLWKACLGGFFALFPAFYLAYLPTTDSFALYMLLGSGVLLALSLGDRPVARLFGAGLLAGLMHLTRADGILWAGIVFGWAAWEGWQGKGGRKERIRWGVGLALSALAGYLAVMMIWYSRNLVLWGGFFPPGGNRSIWLTRYEDIFIFPANQLTPLRWLSSGWEAIIAARWQALMSNLQTLVAVQGSIALFPFLLVGLWKMRRLRIVYLGLGMWLVNFIMMTIVFPFAGINGSFFHSGAALQPLFWAVAPLGIAEVVAWLAHLRKWEHGPTVRRFLEILLVTVCFLLTVGIYFQRVIGDSAAGVAWNRGLEQSKAEEARLVDFGAAPDEAVMVNDPPGYYAASGRSAVVIPFGDESAVLAAARKYSARYLLLDENNAWHLDRLYNQPEDLPGLHYLGTLDTTRIYAFTVQ